MVRKWKTLYDWIFLEFRRLRLKNRWSRILWGIIFQLKYKKVWNKWPCCWRTIKIKYKSRILFELKQSNRKQRKPRYFNWKKEFERSCKLVTYFLQIKNWKLIQNVKVSSSGCSLISLERNFLAQKVSNYTIGCN